MKYYPKSQIKTNLFTNGGEFTRADNNLPYVGAFWKTSTGQTFSGKSPQDTPYVALVATPVQEEQTPFNQTTEWQTAYPSKLINSKPGQIPASYLFNPSQDDIDFGQVTRYFTKKSNQKIYYEISKEDFTKLSSKSSEILYQLYTPISMIWRLDGDTEEAYKANLTTAKDIQTRQQLPGFVKSFKGRFATAI